MHTRHYDYFREVPNFRIGIYNRIIETFPGHQVPFSVYQLSKGALYYLLDEQLNRLFLFRDRFGRPINKKSEIGKIVLAYYMAYPENQLHC
ncbi:hypothetical protein [Dyadobacter sandarakinus]|uniref:Uncharacterized protein n=1 Tax=Dyadobacter sandarakinus TaxID=2747268 RepID=A0ABX7I651_9BACT|nr:hypothetical protein [Dyadobacter sandarakinus]QRR00663.1 hypothetical protein HWI92_06960 [Dyadobacter sandarakinus]